MANLNFVVVRVGSIAGNLLTTDEGKTYPMGNKALAYVKGLSKGSVISIGVGENGHAMWAGPPRKSEEVISQKEIDAHVKSGENLPADATVEEKKAIIHARVERALIRKVAFEVKINLQNYESLGISMEGEVSSDEEKQALVNEFKDLIGMFGSDAPTKELIEKFKARTFPVVEGA